jgi:hypothetical protein
MNGLLFELYGFHKLRQLGDIGRDPPRLILGK